MEERKNVCVWCGQVIDNPDDIREDYNGDMCCEECFDARCCYCNDCGRVCDVDYVRPVDGGDIYVCEDCASNYYQCTDCGELFTSRHIALADGSRDDYICTDCETRNDWAQCEDCGYIDYTWRLVWSDENTCYYCEDCAPEHETSAALHDYGYKPQPDFRCTDEDDGTSRYYGVELEIDDGKDAGDCADDLTAITDAIYCKHDGSLGDEGVEIVTHPATLNYHLTTMPWADIISTARGHGYTSHDAGTCGLHVHVGRAELPDDAPEKLVALVDAIWGELVTFSRRDVSALRRWAAKPDAGITRDDSPTSGKDKMDKARARGRYQAVNLQNYSTIEFRMFRGSLVLQTIRATLECVDLLCEYAAQHSLPDCAGATWADIRALGAGMDEFCAYCDKRGI